MSLLFVSCERRDFSLKAPSEDRITFTTYNAEWLGDGINDRKPRTENEYKIIAEMLLDLNSDIIALQEVENDVAITKLINFMHDYDFIAPDEFEGEQNVAVLYHKSVKVKLDYIANDIEVIPGETRPAIVADISKNNFKCKALIVHFKSTSRYDSTEQMKKFSREIRLKQSIAANNVIKKEIDKGVKNIIMLGDFNDYPLRKTNNTLYPILLNEQLEFITLELRSCRFSFSYSIDNIVISDYMKNSLIPNSLWMYDIKTAYPDYIAKSISDHCPVCVSFML